jgi:hypothetical protein
MLQFKNKTPFQGTILLAPDPKGIESAYTIIKATYILGETLQLGERQEPINQQDQYYGDSATSSIKQAGDIGLVKPGTDVLLHGTAYAPYGRPLRQMDVFLKVGPVCKELRVFGDRVWRKSLFGARISDPQLFIEMPLMWEKAFGGFDETEDKAPQTVIEDRNPVGCGLRAKNSKNDLDGMKLPNIEDPRQLVSSWKDRPTPAGFGAVCPHWQPRRGYAGTYDERWKKQRAPYLPKDFDARFFQIAPPDLVKPGYLSGGEVVELIGVSQTGQLAFTVPNQQVQVTYQLDDRKQLCPAYLDTVLIEPDLNRVVLIWRSMFPCDKKALRIREIEATVGNA